MNNKGIQQLVEQASALIIYTEMICKMNEILVQFERERQQIECRRRYMQSIVEQLIDEIRQKDALIDKLQSRLNRYQTPYQQSIQQIKQPYPIIFPLQVKYSISQPHRENHLQQDKEKTKSQTSNHKSNALQPKSISPQLKCDNQLKPSHGSNFIKQLFPSSQKEKENHLYPIKTPRQRKINHTPFKQNQNYLNSNRKYLNLNAQLKHIKFEEKKQDLFDNKIKSPCKQQTQKGWKHFHFLLQNVKPRKIPFSNIHSPRLKI